MKFSGAKDYFRTAIRFLFTAFAIGMAIWFFYHERDEILDIRTTISHADMPLLIAGLVLVVVYLMLQAEMYRQSFLAVGAKVPLFVCGVLYVKRNFISVFIPAGGISSLAFFSGDIEKRGVSSSKVNLASTIFGFVGILTVILVAIPAFIYAFFVSSLGAGEWIGLGIMAVLTTALGILFKAIRSKGKIYDWLVMKFPSVETFLTEIAEGQIQKKHFIYSIVVSFLIELTGIVHLYISMHALNTQISLFACVMGYIVAIIFMLISPFLRGMGAVELSMAYLLSRFGLEHSEAVSVTLLFRFYEFWLPLLAGLLAFMLPFQKLILRILPALFLMLLGAVNILSVLTPALKNRVRLLEHFVPVELVSASNYLVFAAGVFLVFTSIYLFKGLRNAWIFALALAVVSGVGHLTKGYDYEEATLAALVIIILVFTRKQYNVRSSRVFGISGLWLAITAVLFTILYGVIGFYLLDKEHFGIDFSASQSVKYTLNTFFLLDTELLPKDNFAHSFLNSIRLLGFSSLLFLLYTLVRPYLGFLDSDPDELHEAKDFLKTAGSGSLDYFKTYSDKTIFWSEKKTAFLAYKIAGLYAVVLDVPVAKTDAEKAQCILEFDKFCQQSGLKSVYYRVNEGDLGLFKKKKKLFLGQEAVVDISDFSLDGGHKKAFRNSIKKIKEAGFSIRTYEPPIENHVVAELKRVSDDWLNEMGDRKEMVFAQGLFDEAEIKNQTIISLEDIHGRIVAFLNIIPDFSPSEGTYDLIRKTTDAPSGAVDYVLISLFLYLKERGYKYVNLGMAPMSGMTEPKEFSERSIKYAYERIKAFSHYKGLRDYKEKFEPEWKNQYLLYENEYDLIRLPQALNEVFKP